MSINVHISIDMEGVSGVVHTDQTGQKGYDYNMMRKAMTLEAMLPLKVVLKLVQQL